MADADFVRRREGEQFHRQHRQAAALEDELGLLPPGAVPFLPERGIGRRRVGQVRLRRGDGGAITGNGRHPHLVGNQLQATALRSPHEPHERNDEVRRPAHHANRPRRNHQLYTERKRPVRLGQQGKFERHPVTVSARHSASNPKRLVQGSRDGRGGNHPLQPVEIAGSGRVGHPAIHFDQFGAHPKELDGPPFQQGRGRSGRRPGVNRNKLASPTRIVDAVPAASTPIRPFSVSTPNGRDGPGCCTSSTVSATVGTPNSKPGAAAAASLSGKKLNVTSNSRGRAKLSSGAASAGASTRSCAGLFVPGRTASTGFRGGSACA